MNQPIESMSRRKFLTVMGGVMGGAAIGTAAPQVVEGGKQIVKAIENMEQTQYDPNFGIEMDGKVGLSFKEAARLAKRFDTLYDKLPKPKIPTGVYGLREMALEIIPQFSYEEITPKSQWPDAVDYVIFNDGASANHVLGRSDCRNFAILNGRLNLNVSTWSKDEIPFTLAHELAHVAQTKQICDQNRDEDIESSAQIAALEVTSGLANQGNPLWLWATIGELRGMALSSAYGLALRDDDFEKYHVLRSKLSPGATSEARFQKSVRRWTDRQNELKEILNNYNIKPLERIIFSIKHNNNEIQDLTFPPIMKRRPFLQSVRKPVLLDDTAYLIKHAEELVNDHKPN